MIKVEDLSYTYGSGTEALDGVSVEFKRGEISSVLGESGSGKTTLLMCLGRFLTPASGRITLDGQDIGVLPERQFRKKVGIVFQKLYLFPHKSVLDNMTLAMVHAMKTPKARAEKEALEMLERLSIADVSKSYPVQISGGQAQRAAIARALLLRPEFLLLDEPTSALDANTTGEFAALIRELKDITNFIIVTHDVLFAAEAADVGVYLSGGRILDSGAIDRIIENVRAGEVIPK